MNIYVGNVDFNVTEEQLTGLFAEYGDVDSVKIISDKFTGRSKGFAFVEMPNDSQANNAIAALNGLEFKSRSLSVNVARPKEENRAPRSGGNYGGGGGGNRSYNRNY